MKVERDDGRAPRVLMVHNAYQQRGGEDAVCEAEFALLAQRGHAVRLYARHNDEIAARSRVKLAAQTVWSRRTTEELARVIEAFRPDVIHAHNTFPLVSPSLYWAADRAGVPVVQTLHNFRLMCPQAMLLREGRVCEDCVGRLPWRGVVRACYRGSIAQSGVLAGTVVLHRAFGTYRHKVTRYVALNRFCRDKFVQAGLPAERIRIKPNFIDSPERPAWTQREGGLFVGRLSPEKGLDVLAAAVRQLPHPRVSVVGDGELAPLARQTFGGGYLGFRPVDEILALMRRALYLVVPSLWYENFPRTIAEAYACGLPVIASRIGALAEIVEDGVTGLLFEPGDAQDLARRLQWAEAHPEAMREMGQAARAAYEAHYTPERNYQQLMEIYADAIEHVRQGARQAA
ncbi:glycosyltransferase [Caldimonas thermodepolymerans]|uniref:Glycosyltransferase involved in cell wall biosynthesis n=1 Tax=Caldimonas thermodepolymerans TaxID=215580 RepID=A0AA46DD15_9BURK|nr:glycosyltransferase [Caldimonas thermodepolymerans]TCP06338.1 glycosyltransferase involved in cell wall biosynthesis [Caldimonas thermodepolymerans]UZG49095.1 glycosyltransferase [Caldimonas thermodepolymerans]